MRWATTKLEPFFCGACARGDANTRILRANDEEKPRLQMPNAACGTDNLPFVRPQKIPYIQ